jgi:hypothetical protein
MDLEEARGRKQASLLYIYKEHFEAAASRAPHLTSLQPPATTAQERKITTCRKQSLRLPIYRYRENNTPRLAADPANIWQHAEPTLWRNQLLIEPTIRHD